MVITYIEAPRVSHHGGEYVFLALDSNVNVMTYLHESPHI